MIIWTHLLTICVTVKSHTKLHPALCQGTLSNLATGATGATGATEPTIPKKPYKRLNSIELI